MKPFLPALLIALLPAAAPAGDEADFRRGLESAKKLAETQRWSLARRELDRILLDHERAPYLLPHLGELVGLHQRCSFFADYPGLDPQDAVSGELQSWDRRTGRIAVRYTELGEDFTDDGQGARLHCMEFTGPYRLEATGRLGAAPTSTDDDPVLPQVLVAVRGRESHQVVFGLPRFESEGQTRWIPPRIVRHAAQGPEVVGEGAETPLSFERRYRITIQVEERSISASVDGRLILQAPKPGDLFGRVAILDLPGLEELVLSGSAGSSWLGAREDAARDAAWQEFRAGWDPATELPPWVVERLRAPAPGSDDTRMQFQYRLAKDQLPALQRLTEHLTAGRAQLGLEELERLEPDDLALELQLFFEALFELRLGRPGAARASIEEAIRVAPGFREARVIHGRVLGELGHEERALALLREVVEEDPTLALAWAELARWCLRSGRPEEAKQVVASALRSGVPHELLRETESLLTRALTGPAWERVFEYRSRHYTVRSDRSRQVCFDAAQELEAALRFYQFRLGRLRANEQLESTYPVYIFSGLAGYESYAGDLFGAAPESTAGLFSPMLKQLLVWNPPEEARLFRTLRHEGLHQYLDACLGRLPTWFNEGMAEYFENTELVRGVPADGRPHELHLALLLDPSYRWIPYAELLEMPAEEFYREAGPKYAQSWALVHFLQNSGTTNARLFGQLLDELARGVDPTSFHRTLLSVDGLETRVEDHLRQLARDS